MKKADKAGFLAAFFAASGAVFAASGCGSGKGASPASGASTSTVLPTGTPTPTPSSTIPPTRQTGNAAVTISWPARSRGHGRLIPSATEYLVLRGVQTVDGAVTFDTTFPRVVRPAGSDAVSQTVTLPNLPVGDVILEASAYPTGSDGSPTPGALAFGAAPLVVQNGQTTPLALALDATLDHFSVDAENVSGEQNNNAASPLQLDKAEVVRLTVSARDKNDAVLLLAPDVLEWRVDNNSGSVLFGVGGSGGAFGTSPVKGASLWVKGVARSASSLSTDTIFVRDVETGKQSGGVFVQVRDPRYHVTRLPDGFVPQAVRDNGDVAGTMGGDTSGLLPLVLFRGGQIVPDDFPPAQGGVRIVARNHRNQAVLLRSETVDGAGTQDVPYFWDNGVETRIGWYAATDHTQRFIKGLSETGGVLGVERLINGTFLQAQSWLWHPATGFTPIGGDGDYDAQIVSESDQVIVNNGTTIGYGLSPQSSPAYYLWENGTTRLIPFTSVPYFGYTSRGWSVQAFDGGVRLVGSQTTNIFDAAFYVWDTATLTRTALSLPAGFSGSVIKGASSGQTLVSTVWTKPVADANAIAPYVPASVLFGAGETEGVDLNTLVSHTHGAYIGDPIALGSNGTIVVSGATVFGQIGPYYLLTPLR